MSLQLPRPPVGLPQHAAGGANTCIAAMLEYVFDTEDRPDPYKVDRELRRKNPAPLGDIDLVLHLLKQYFRCQVITEDTDARLIQFGLQHIRRVYAGEWTADQAHYYSASRVKQLQTEARRNLARKRLFANQYSELAHQATIQDIRHHLGEKHAVSLVVKMGPKLERALFVPHTDGRSTWLYVPRLTESSVLRRARTGDLLPSVQFGRPVIALWR